MTNQQQLFRRKRQSLRVESKGIKQSSSKDIPFDDNDADNNNGASEQVPLLRRESSSLLSVASSSSSSSFMNENGIVVATNDGNDESSSCGMSNLLAQQMWNTLLLQWKGLTQDFKKNNMPWNRIEDCRSFMAGGTGFMYALPALACFLHNNNNNNNNNDFNDGSSLLSLSFMEPAIWIFQAFLSIMADYVHIHHDSIWHGMDRYFATFNLIFIIARACRVLNLSILFLTIPPVGCFIGASQAKRDLNINLWHWCHCGWHIFGGILGGITIHLIYHCPDQTTTTTATYANLEHFCQAI